MNSTHTLHVLIAVCCILGFILAGLYSGVLWCRACADAVYRKPEPNWWTREKERALLRALAQGPKIHEPSRESIRLNHD